jgi:acyl-CoA thioesterase FadM
VPVNAGQRARCAPAAIGTSACDDEVTGRVNGARTLRRARLPTELPVAGGVRQDRRISDLAATHLAITHRSTVTEDQIDHLGHMNVRFYGENARAGSAVVLADLTGDTPITFTPVFVYTRHHREQMLGARLVVKSGVLDVRADELRLYHELLNEDSGVVAATFVHRLRADDGVELPAAVAERARNVVVPISERGQARSIDLDADPIASAPGLDVMRERDLAIRRPRTVAPEECGPDGVVLRANAPGLVWGGEPIERRLPALLHDGPNGEKMGWASMETRIAIRRLPRAGDRIESFSAVVGLRDKTSHRILWAYDTDAGDLLMSFEIVNLAFDTLQRAPMSIPDEIRAVEQSDLHEDLNPRS